MQPERTKMLSVRRAQLHVHELGPIDAPPLLVLHGGPGEAHDVLRPHLDALASSLRRVVHYDQRGGGRSPLEAGAPHVGWREHVEDVESVRAHLGAPRIDVLGFSWGALLALLHALEHRDRVRRLVLVSPPPLRARGGVGAGALDDATNRASVREVIARLAREAVSGDAELVRRARFASRIAAGLFDPELVALLTPVDVDEDAARAAESSVRDLDLRPQLPRLRDLPVLVVTGQDDPLSAPAAAETAGALGARHVEIASCGHAPFVEAPELFLAAVSAFLDTD